MADRMKRAFSFGGGRQSTAALVLAARGELDVDCFVFANVGDDAENPETLDYVSEVSWPFAEKHGIELVQVQRKFRDGRDPSLYQYVLNTERSFPLPMRMEASGAPANRSCTLDWKIRVVARYLSRERGWTECEMALGISWDESHRMRDPEGINERGLVYHRVYPLCERRITLADCERIVAEAGLPPAPKSACWFCPFHSLAGWASMRLRQPDRFAAAVELERSVSEKSTSVGRGRLFLTDRLKPLDVAVPQGSEQLGMFDNDEGHCTSGYCWT